MENTDTTFITSYKLSMTGQLEPCPHNNEDGSVYKPGEFDDLVPIGRRYGVRSTLAAPAREPAREPARMSDRTHDIGSTVPRRICDRRSSSSRTSTSASRTPSMCSWCRSSS